LYTQVWLGKPVRDDETNPLVPVLRLSGIVAAGDTRCGVRGRGCGQADLPGPSARVRDLAPPRGHRISNPASLRGRHPGYARVFDHEWIKANSPGAELRRQKVAFRRGVLRATAVASVLLAVVSVLAGAAIYQRRLSQERLARMYISTGMRRVDDDDTLRALP